MTLPPSARPSALLHVTLVATDLTATLAFYDAALAAVGIGRHSDFPDEEESDAEVDAVGYAAPDDEPVLWVVAGSHATRGAHLAFAAPSRAAVQRFWSDGLAAGGQGRQAPRTWEIYRPGYFGALLADPDGNLLEAVTSE